ncbi:MBL fold metallo-hydrolase [Paenibacillus sanguinis]|uniref:MBL fold metallo-hydrolase n=1 Tax=Paenibacillus sanguinis TaxID=225906 RepID=UPI000379B5E9|nr:MBL fold metallo-hydrolase [Paenibacillus sanguinis]
MDAQIKVEFNDNSKGRNRMELTVIGYWGAFPARNEATSGYLLRHKECAVLLDCGSGVLSRLQNEVGLEQLDAVFITHTHADHFADAYALEFATLVLTQIGKRTRPLDVYVYSEDLEGLQFAYPEYIRVHLIDTRQTVKVGEVMFTFQETIHEVPCCAIKATSPEGTSIVYSGDTGFCQSFIEFASGADLLVLESSFYEVQKGMMSGHLTAGEAGEVARLAGAGHLILTHLPHYGEHQQLKLEAGRYYEGPIELAHSGLKWSL